MIRGCVPKKLMVYASRFADDFADAAGYGWTVGETRFDWATLIANKDREIARLEGIYEANLQKAGVEIFPSRAVVEGPNSVRLVASGRVISARVILVATGGPADVDPAPRREHIVTSNEIFHLEHQPRRIVVAAAAISRSSSPRCWPASAPRRRWSIAARRSCAASTTTSAEHVRAELESVASGVIVGDIFTGIDERPRTIST